MADLKRAASGRASKLWMALAAMMLLITGTAAPSVLTSAGAAEPGWTVTTAYTPVGDGYSLTVAGTVPPNCSKHDAVVRVSLGADEYSEIAANGGPFSVTFSGLPSGGGHTVTITVVNGTTACELPMPFTTTVPLDWDDDVLPATATVGTSYDDAVVAVGGSGGITYRVSSGSLPAGLVLGASGAVTGTPTQTGGATFAIEAEDSVGETIEATFTITVGAQTTLTGPAWVDDAVVATATTGTAYADAVLAVGNPTPTYAITAGALPPGLSLGGTTGLLTGTVGAAGDHPFTVSASNSVGTIHADLIIRVASVVVRPDPGTVNPGAPTPGPAPAPVPAPGPVPGAAPAPASPSPTPTPQAAAPVPAPAPAAPALAVNPTSGQRPGSPTADVRRGALARTGTSTGPLVALGALLLGVGASLSTAGRRRSHRLIDDR